MFRKNKKKRSGKGRVNDKIISSSLRLGIHERYLGMQKNWRSEAFGFERFESTGRLASRKKGCRSKILANPSAAAGVCTSRKVQAMEEGDVEGRHGGRGGGLGGRRDERVTDPLSRGEGESVARAKRRDGDGGNTCSGRVHAFQGFRESGEYDGGDVSLNI